jgi:hypothetical protein
MKSTINGISVLYLSVGSGHQIAAEVLSEAIKEKKTIGPFMLRILLPPRVKYCQKYLMHFKQYQ